MGVDFFAEEVKRPGKYQGEEPYVPYFDQFDGEDGLSEDGVRWWRVEEEDVALFPQLRGRERVALCTTNDGFVVEVDSYQMNHVNYLVSEATNDRVSCAVRKAVTRDVYDEVYESVYVVVDDEVDFVLSPAVRAAVREELDGK